MKRRSNPAQKSGQSPYSKYKKKPYKYSDAYYAWKRKVMRKD